MVVDLCISLAAPFWKIPHECILWALMQFPAVEAKINHLSSLRPLAPRMWNDDLGLDKWPLPSLHQMTEQLKFIHSSGLVALSCSHLNFCLRKADSFLRKLCLT